MLIALVRPVETRTVEVVGSTLADVQEQLQEHREPGFDLVAAPVHMLKGEAAMKATGTFCRVDGITEIEADDMPALEQKIPEGSRMLSVRRA